MDPIELPSQMAKEEMPDLESLLEYNDIVRMTFDSEEEGFEFYNDYGYGKGFSVRRSYSEYDNRHSETRAITHRRFVCSRQGFREEKHLKRAIKKHKPRRITRVGCPAKLVIARDQNLQWYVKDFIDEHSHPMAPPELTCLLRSHRRISDDQKAEIVEMEIAGICKHQIMDIFEIQYGGYDQVGFTARDLYNFCHCYKVETIAAGDVQTVIRYLTAQQHKDPDFFFKYMVDGEGHLKGLFWCDSQCLLDYQAFGDVVVFDSTYKTNRYNVPLVPFVGVNHHRSTVIFGCGIAAHEDTESYVWMLTAFSEAMIQKHPVSVITDGDRAMQRAISLVWPNSSHRLCVWHIERCIVRNVQDKVVKDELRTFLYDRCSIQEIERKWMKFLADHEVTDKDSWLYQMFDMREIWCAAYHVGKCYLGLRSNQRSESLNSRLHMRLDRKMTLLDMVRHLDQCLSGVRNIENKLDLHALQSDECQPGASAIEIEAAQKFSSFCHGAVQHKCRQQVFFN